MLRREMLEHLTAEALEEEARAAMGTLREVALYLTDIYLEKDRRKAALVKEKGEKV